MASVLESNMQVVAMDRGVKEDINAALWELGVETPRDDVALRSQMAYGMFDTRGKCVNMQPVAHT